MSGTFKRVYKSHSFFSDVEINDVEIYEDFEPKIEFDKSPKISFTSSGDIQNNIGVKISEKPDCKDKNCKKDNQCKKCVYFFKRLKYIIEDLQMKGFPVNISLNVIK